MRQYSFMLLVFLTNLFLALGCATLEKGFEHYDKANRTVNQVRRINNDVKQVKNDTEGVFN